MPRDCSSTIATRSTRNRRFFRELSPTKKRNSSLRMTQPERREQKRTTGASVARRGGAPSVRPPAPVCESHMSTRLRRSCGGHANCRQGIRRGQTSKSVYHKFVRLTAIFTNFFAHTCHQSSSINRLTSSGDVYPTKLARMTPALVLIPSSSSNRLL